MVERDTVKEKPRSRPSNEQGEIERLLLNDRSDLTERKFMPLVWDCLNNHYVPERVEFNTNQESDMWTMAKSDVRSAKRFTWSTTNSKGLVMIVS